MLTRLLNILVEEPLHTLFGTVRTGSANENADG